MKSFINRRIGFLLLLSIVFSLPVLAQISEKEISKMFGPKGTYRAPFKKATEVGLVSVNLRFKLASSERTEKRNVGNVISWAVLEGINDQVFQEIADEYYQRLSAKFSQSGYAVNDKFKQTKGYAVLAEKEHERVTFKKNWGVAEVYTANKGPYLEFPVMLGPQARMGNELKNPVGQVLITIDFAQILQSISKDTEYGILANVRNTTTTSSKATIYPAINIEGPSESGINLRGDGTYAKFAGDNYSYSNAVLTIHKPIISTLDYAEKVESSKGIPEIFKRFKSDVIGDMVNLFSRGAIASGRATGEFTFIVKADPQKYKAAVLDALDKYNDYLMAYIQSNN